MQFLEVAPHPTRGWTIAWFIEDEQGRKYLRLMLSSTFKKKIAIQVGGAAAEVLSKSARETVELKVKNLLGHYTAEGRTYGYDDPKVKG